MFYSALGLPTQQEHGRVEVSLEQDHEDNSLESWRKHLCLQRQRVGAVQSGEEKGMLQGNLIDPSSA